MRRLITAVLAFITFLALGISTGLADMGRILTSDVSVSEASQKAIILHNFEEEVLILGTDLVSAQDTRIIRFIPFPSEPKVTLAKGKPFDVALKLIKKCKLKFLSQTKSIGGRSNAVAVEIRFNARLGAHDATMVKVNSIEEFGDWVRKFLKDKGLFIGKDYQNVERIASDYVKRGLDYFVFDLVSVTPDLHFVEPLVYRFRCKKLYYPLKTSNTFGGKGEIDLIIISPVTLCSPTDPSCLEALGAPWQVKVSTSTKISLAEAKSVLSDAINFFKGEQDLFFQLIRYQGEYVFNEDIVFDLSNAPRGEFGVPEESHPILDSDYLARGWQKTARERAVAQQEAPDPRCSLLPDPGGPCEAHMKKYYYDQEEGKCKSFFWLGCGGVVPFDSLEECERACRSSSRRRGPSTPSPTMEKPILVHSEKN